MSRARLLMMLAFALTPAVVVVATACLDITPIYVAPKDTGVISDASCTMCLEVPSEAGGCGAVLDQCRADPRCAPVLVCLDALSCFDQPVLVDKINCGLPCLEDAGITTTTDPVVNTLLELIQCGQVECTIECNLGDGGITLDAL